MLVQAGAGGPGELRAPARPQGDLEEDLGPSHISARCAALTMFLEWSEQLWPLRGGAEFSSCSCQGLDTGPQPERPVLEGLKGH